MGVCKSIKVKIKTNKGYICERDDYATYPLKSTNEYYAKGFSKGFFNTENSNCNTVDMLGFTDDREKAMIYSSNQGNRIQEIIDRVKWGYEDISFITIEILPNKE